MTSNDAAPVPSGTLPTLAVEGLLFRDLDHDGVLAPYEDWRLPAETRARDLVSRMTVEEKAGTMLHGSAPSHGYLGGIGVGSAYDLEGLTELVHGRSITSMITRLSVPPREFAEQNNALQELAAAARLGIPVTVSTDPRHHFAAVVGASNNAAGFTQWPETLGLAAIGDPEVVREFGDVVRREYRAIGIQMFLGPQADLVTSQRWPRGEGTFGENPELVGALVGAYIEGLQGGRGGLGPSSVAAVVKHWVGYGASRDGFDGHNHYGRFSAFPSDALADHIRAFDEAFAVGVAQVMPTYNILEGVELEGKPLEQVGAGFSDQLINGLLRGVHGFAGVVLSDWSITDDLTEPAITGEPPQTPEQIAMPWGVEDLTREERFARCINAGVDQIGGEDDPLPLLAAIESGAIRIERVDEACLRILIDKFRLGLFEAPLVDLGAVQEQVATTEAVAAARVASSSALTWITLPANRPLLTRDTRVYLDGIEAADGLTVTSDPASADLAVVRVDTPHQLLHPGHFFGSRQHEGDLDFRSEDPAVARLLDLCRTLPTVLVVHLDRPAVLGPLADRALAVLGEFGASDHSVLDVLTGAAQATGRLPFRLHATMADVLAEPCDRPSAPGRFPFGHSASA